MSRNLTFVYLDGREIQGGSPREVLEALRAGESASASDLGRFLDLIYSRAALTFSIALDVGDPRASLDARCRAALASLVQHGWLRIKEDRVSWPRARSSASMAERKVSTAAAWARRARNGRPSAGPVLPSGVPPEAGCPI